MNDEHRTPMWVGIILFLLAIMALASMDQRDGHEGNGNNDDGCSSGVSQMGCFP